eukprot:XP_011444304.1 PREDICTED: uncharacterized protein LOC105340119 [Crassostrea gigas]
MWKLQIFVCVVAAASLRCSEAALPPSCTFNNGWCQWRPLINSRGFTWQLGSNSTRDRLSGPDGDHTTKYGNGSYIFIRGHDGRNSSIAVVESNVDVTSDLQISFWYYMNGVGIGKLTLGKVENGAKTVLWEKQGRQGPSWIQASVNLPRGSYVISFSATARLIYGGDLAVDDVEIAPITTTTHAPTSTLPPSRKLPFACNFDLGPGACGMDLIPSIGNNVGWNITSKTFTHLGYTYIPGDSSGQKGNYLLLNNWNLGENGDAAQIVSPVLQNAGVACLSFKLYQAKISSGTLSVYQRLLPSMELVLLSEEAKKSSRTPSEWKTVMITLRNSKYFQIVLEGSYTGYLGSVIGVDDIKIENGDCILTTTSATTTLTSTQQTLPPTTSSLQSTKLTESTDTTKTQVGISSKLTTKTAPFLTTLKSSPSSTLSSRSSPATTSTVVLSTSSSTSLKSTSTSPTKHVSSTTTLSSSISSPATTSSIVLSTLSSTATTLSIVPSTSSSTSSKSSTTTEPKKLSSTKSSFSISSPATTSSIVLSTLLSTSLKSSPISSMTRPVSSSTTRVTSTVSPTPSLTSTTSQLPTLKSSTQSSTWTPNPTVLSSLLSTKRPAIVSTTYTQTSKTSTGDILSPQSSTSSLSSPLTSTFSSEIPLTTNVFKTLSILQSTTTTKSTTKVDTSKTSTLTSHTPDVKSSTSSPTEAHNTAGRETTAIVLGVCLPIIALVIVSVIVLICKKDNGSKLNSIQNQKKIRKEEKNPNDNIEMTTKDDNKDQVAVTGFRKLDT